MKRDRQGEGQGTERGRKGEGGRDARRGEGICRTSVKLVPARLH